MFALFIFYFATHRRSLSEVEVLQIGASGRASVLTSHFPLQFLSPLPSTHIDRKPIGRFRYVINQYLR